MFLEPGRKLGVSVGNNLAWDTVVRDNYLIEYFGELFYGRSLVAGLESRKLC